MKIGLNLRSLRHVIGLMAISKIVVWGNLFFFDFFEKNEDMINFFGFWMTLTAVLIAVLQSVKSHDWNRRKAAAEALKEFREKMRPHSKILNESFNYFLRDENSPITVDEIHRAICKKGNDGKLVRCDSSAQWEIDPDKGETLRSVRELLNLYEDIASGVHQGVYDKEVVADLMASSIIKVSNIFDPYIKHFNEDMYPASQGRVWLNVKTLGREFKKRYREDSEAKEREQT
mgnify:CR=1 FL=1